MENIGKSRRIVWICTVLLICSVWPAIKSSATPEANEIREKMTAIVLLREKIKQNRSQAVKIYRKLNEQKSALAKEIKAEHRRLGHISYENGIRVPRIQYDLKLMQKILLYISILDERIACFEVGLEELTFVYQQAHDFLKIIETLRDIELNELMSQTNHILLKQRGAGDRFWADFDHDEQLVSKKIWEAIIDE